jgi:hypothetical protein
MAVSRLNANITASISAAIYSRSDSLSSSKTQLIKDANSNTTTASGAIQITIASPILTIDVSSILRKLMRS